jgi:hypothetical protein
MFFARAHLRVLQEPLILSMPLLPEPAQADRADNRMTRVKRKKNTILNGVAWIQG